MIQVFVKRPDEVLDYVIDFTRWLSTGDTIQSVAGTVSSTESGTVAIDSTSHDEATATAFVSAGIDGETATVTLQVVTALGRTKEGFFKIRVKEIG